ncbi:hypothetical protein [Microbacterium nymphoidis]|uniref:hypothetical protein n=1 Tax=Microbacterium nymphoidis TaxID=2898586 RepID=UPI001E488450|nr:hypothetical protein [Microbacterium nymphoidis]MCD2497019.1 hypothetical protein [Microbacterium nymphoidis]
MDTQTRTSGVDTATLGLGSVLVGSLPAALMTDHAPARYSVEAVFTRRPEHNEVKGLLGARTLEVLAEGGYSDVRLAVADRRLIISNTTLEDLRDGLASVLATRIAEISSEIQTERSLVLARRREAAVVEESRVAAVTALAESVTFGAAHVAAPARQEDAAQSESWATEGGGHGR